ncbi:MAG: 30S ribosomal protein S13 [Fusobacteriota bacterium]
MARIAGVDLPRNKRVVIALTYIFGIGKSLSQEILEKADIDENVKAKELTDTEAKKIREIISEDYLVEGELRKEKKMALKRLKEIKCYRGIRHIKGLPVRGQKTKNNAQTRKKRR